jgi:hypothetical protein
MIRALLLLVLAGASQAQPIPPLGSQTRVTVANAHAEHGHTLITVTEGGKVGEARSFKTEQLCLQAASIAQTGMTIEELQTREQARRALFMERVEQCRPGKLRTAAHNRCDEFIFDKSGQLVGSGSTISSREISPGDIKYARCVPESP